MTDLPWSVQLTDGCATDAALAHATAVGLFEVIDRFRFADPGAPTPAPGIADLPGEIHRHAIDVIHAAATVHLLTDDADSDPAAVDDAVMRAELGAIAARRGVRRLAQIGLGVAQHSHDGDEVELLERTMVAVFADARSELAAIDAFPLVGRTRAECSVELAGLIARLICEQPLAGPDDHVGVRLVGAGHPSIAVTVTADAGVMVDDTTFAAPVTITEVTAAILDRVAEADADPLAHLGLDWDLP